MAFSAAGPPAGYAGMMGGPSSGHTRVSYKRAPNFLERLGGSMCGSIVGLFLIAGACALLFLNEVCTISLSPPFSLFAREVFERCMSFSLQGRSVHMYNMLVGTSHICKPVKSPDSVYSVLDNQLIYLSGKLSTSGPVSDVEFGVSGKESEPTLGRPTLLLATLTVAGL